MSGAPFVVVIGPPGVGKSTVASCLEGPVFRGDRVRWEAFDDGLCRVPSDAVGAPKEAR